MLMERIKKMRDKSNCFDLFWKIRLNNKKMYKQDSVYKQVQFRFEKHRLQCVMDKLLLLK